MCNTAAAYCKLYDGFLLPRPTKEFVELGEPQNPSEEVKQAIREAGALKAEEMGILTPEDNKVAVTMENNAVVLLEYFPV